MMLPRNLLWALGKTWVLALSLSCLCGIGTAQLEPASPPLADPADIRFKDVKEDWSTPALSSSSLRAATPIIDPIINNTDYTVDLIQVQWRWGDPIDLYVMKPKGVEKPPVILYLYGFPIDTDNFKDETYQKMVTKDGFAAVGFVSALTGHRFHDRSMRDWFVSELQECLGKSVHDVQMILNYLDTRDDLDTSRIGMYGFGSGGTIGILASAVDARIKVLDVMNPWGDWPIWMAKSPLIPKDERGKYVKPEFLRKAATLEPLDWLPKIQARKFRFEDTPFETKTPESVKKKLRAAAAPNSTVLIYKTPEEFNAVVRGNKELGWMQQELRSLAPGSKPVTEVSKETPGSGTQ
jgi:hypothetical protein